MELKDLKQNDLVSFRFGSDTTLHRGIFSHISKCGNPVFVLTDMGYENQEFVSNIFDLCDILLRPAISNEYQYIKECITDDKISRLKLQIELREEQIERLKKGDFIPSFDDVLNFIDPYD